MNIKLGIITDFFLKIYNDKIIRSQYYQYKQVSSKVFIIRNNKSRASRTIGKTIFLHELIFTKYSQRVQDFIFLHEYGHLTMNKYLKVILYPSLIFMAGSLAFFSFILVLNVAKYLVYPYSITQNTIVNSFSLFLYAIFGFIGINWINELYAEIFAVNELGFDNYLNAINEIDKIRPKTFINKIIDFVSLPPKSLRKPFLKLILNEN
ncbi:hypothetical protein ACFL0D_03230 [Thermoproteota archaeon]